MLANYSLKKLFDGNNGGDEKLMEYAKLFNGDLFKFETMNGSGPYEFVKWDYGDKLVLKRKPGWWGDKVNKNRNVWFDAFPEYIEYVTIRDSRDAIEAIKEGRVDVIPLGIGCSIC